MNKSEMIATIRAESKQLIPIQMNTNELSIKERLKAPSPDLFVTIQKWAAFVVVAAPVVSGALIAAYPNSPVAVKITAVCGGAAMVCGIVVKVIAMLPVDHTKIEANKTADPAPENNEIPKRS